MDIELSYTPITEITEESYDAYLSQSALPKIPKKFAIEPLEEAMKQDERDTFEFREIRIRKSSQKRKSISWEKVYSSLLEFLKIRADDSRARNVKDSRFFEGLGFCISVESLMNFISEKIKTNTLESEFIRLGWPSKRRGEEYPHEIMLPERDYSFINYENVRTVLKAKRFCSGLEAEVVKAFKRINQEWYERETGVSKDNLPSKEQSPVKRTRKVGKGKYIFIALVREEVPQYKDAIESLQAELTDLANEVSLEGYRVKKHQGKVFVNIKNVLERLNLEGLRKRNLIKVEGRYEIVP